jgi:hypothetical protein
LTLIQISDFIDRLTILQIKNSFVLSIKLPCISRFNIVTMVLIEVGKLIVGVDWVFDFVGMIIKLLKFDICIFKLIFELGIEWLILV